MICPKCGTMLPDNAKFCGVCGQAFQQSQQHQQNGGQQYQNQQQYNQQFKQQQYNQQNYQQQSSGENASIDRRVIVNPSEKILSSMRTSPLKTFLTGGGFGKTEMFFTDKRFYAKFKDVILWRGTFDADAVIDLEHITGTVLLQSNPIILIIYAVIMFIVGIVAATAADGALIVPFWILGGIFIFLFFMGRRIQLKVSYEGDSFIVPMKGCSYANADKFHKDLRNYLDKIKR